MIMIRNSSIFLFACIAIILCSCSNREGELIGQAYQLSFSNPDSALALLNTINRHHLNSSDEARYALVYTIAQDKSGLDVDSDSLIDIAYSYYNNKERDSLYAKCMYYMGNCYSRNDRSEMALDCFKKAISASRKQHDSNTLCLALSRMSALLGNTDPSKAVALAKEAEHIYSQNKAGTLVNKVYYKLSLCEALMANNELSAAENVCTEALHLAQEVGDSTLVSDVCQDMASTLRDAHKYQQELTFSKRSYYSAPNDNESKGLNLAWAFLNTDSLDQCEQILSEIKTQDPACKYTQNYLYYTVYNKDHNYDKASLYADSAFACIEKMYVNEMAKKDKHYAALVASQYEKGILKGKARSQFLLYLIIAVSLVVVIIALIYAFQQQKKKSQVELRAKEEKQLIEQRIHQDQMKLKERQISIMRSFVLKKIDTAQKIEKIKKGAGKEVLLHESDWEEIILFIDGVDDSFVTRLQQAYPNLTEEEIRFLILIRAGVSARAISKIYNIQEKSVKQKLFMYKAKFGLEGKNMSLRKFIETF